MERSLCIAWIIQQGKSLGSDLVPLTDARSLLGRILALEVNAPFNFALYFYLMTQ